MTQLYIKQRLTASVGGIDSFGVLLLTESLSAMLLYEEEKNMSIISTIINMYMNEKVQTNYVNNEHLTKKICSWE